MGMMNLGGFFGGYPQQSQHKKSISPTPMLE